MSKIKQFKEHFSRYLWSNGPKECLEFPYYTFEKHFGKPIPSFPPRFSYRCVFQEYTYYMFREVLFDYLKGRWSQEDIQKYIKFSTVVRDVVYNKTTDDFTVSVKDLKNDEVIDGERYEIIILNGI